MKKLSAALMALLLEYFTSEIDELDQENVCIRILGDKDGLPPPQREALYKAEERTGKNTGLKLNIAINYGGRAELARAARELAQMALRGEISPDEIDEEILTTINKFLENNLNVSETSRQLYIHRNTLVYRIEKLQKAIGLDMRVFDDALTFKIALMVIEYLRYLEKNE